MHVASFPCRTSGHAIDNLTTSTQCIPRKHDMGVWRRCTGVVGYGEGRWRCAHHGHRTIYILICCFVAHVSAHLHRHHETALEPLGCMISITLPGECNTYMRHQNALSAFGPAQHTLGAHMHAQSPHRSLHGRRQRLQMGGDTNGGRHCW
jgi:hypothetical protein